ncbi:MAG: hypothetical protein RL701_7797 [Pseudomonadota bacterium]|jgi:hypothetical protein
MSAHDELKLTIPDLKLSVTLTWPNALAVR